MGYHWNRVSPLSECLTFLSLVPQTSLDEKHDCGNKYCSKSSSHPPNCKLSMSAHGALTSFQYFGPDRNQTTSEVSTAYCTPCQEGFFDKPIIIRRHARRASSSSQ
ncbi:hypothetical protein GGX14DRAFT_439450 [Mycena pura]|uniref:C2H2-type domain-containing protein n=1 Tax=Mycena pura TaxID=153505 RepID=A0AAD6YHR6_9AGAR|nr:hypothetical protein GGX14DRAFT_439450 [Mycena pura]